MSRVPLISAHRGGAGTDRARENTLGALREAPTTGCEFVEFDVQRCRDGVFVVHHDRFLREGRRQVPIASLTFEEFAARAGAYLLLDDVLAELRGRTRVHLDLKFLTEVAEVAGTDPPAPRQEVALVAHIVDVMGVDNVVVTGLRDESVAAVRAWSRDRLPGLLVGLSLSRDVGLRGLRMLLTGRFDEVLPGRRLRACDANLVVCQRTQARLWGARWARRRGLPLLVWTVDRPEELRSWLADGRAWMVTTNFPRQAVELRRRLAAAAEDADTGADADAADAVP